MKRAQFCTSIAFIPWNSKRSERELAGMFIDNPESYSLCVHGCDHTRGEFGVTSESELQEKSRLALARMEQHRKLSGVNFDNVMVFPQGIFSTVAMKALKSCKYLAAVNSTPYPIDATDSLTLCDLLQVAVTRFSNFPLFTRRYPKSMAELAFDLFIGKPALVVEHHGFFRNGYDPLAETVAKLNSLDERLQWSGLGTVCSQTCLKKIDDNGSIHILFFTDRFKLQNQTGQRQEYSMSRRSVADDAPKAITVNGRPVNIRHEGGYVTTTVSLEQGGTAVVEIERDHPEPMRVPSRQNSMYKIKVFVRRMLSEFRDNYVDTKSFTGKPTRAR